VKSSDSKPLHFEPFHVVCSSSPGLSNGETSIRSPCGTRRRGHEPERHGDAADGRRRRAEALEVAPRLSAHDRTQQVAVGAAGEQVDP